MTQKINVDVYFYTSSKLSICTVHISFDSKISADWEVLQSDMNSLDSKLINQSVDEMNSSSNIQITTRTFADVLKPKKDKPVSEPIVEIINRMNEYSNQKKGRENNIIIFGLKNVKKETSSDHV